MKASACSVVSEMDRIEEPYRMTTIRINRSAALVQFGRTEEAVRELLLARQGSLEMVDRTLLGHVDFNLALVYQRLNLYGSMFEAAESAAQSYTSAGQLSSARRAQAVMAAALAYLGKKKLAQELVDALISVTEDEDNEQLQKDLSI